MKITLLVVGKTTSGYLAKVIDEYTSRISHYVKFDIQYLADIKNSRNQSESQQKVNEGRLIVNAIERNDYVVLLDEHGKELTSVAFADYIQKRMLGGAKRLVFVVGGPYGFSQEVYDRADDRLSLSQITFSHEMVRLIFAEQLYRAFTILRGEPYHHS